MPRTAAPPMSRALELVRFDPAPPHRPPRPAAVALATVVAVAASLAADWLLARAGIAAFPATRGYQHFQFGDYAKLTIVGIVGAAVAWPITVRLCRTPRWLYVRLAVVVTAVLLLPDLAIWVQGQPGDAVLWLVLMHLAIGAITYLSLTRLAPERAAGDPARA